ncbi:probable G-protein coupled receptor Mth-like 3 isoform X6 [Procambarus clarkii]|uniref:probable G-protein coupled receptor Mth-like 3 isoform X6 n=1 Tax=Procambarus clarkii TaxID=6728 RepID=UPI001E672F40|nr:probable G-protein coupled receptor Mth-like 3 isoform X2 [Procambarus clarkii]
MTRKRFSVWWVVMVVVIEAMGVYSSENSLPSASVKPTTTSSDRSSDIQRLANMVIPRCLSNSSVSDALVPPIVTLTNDTNEAFNIKFEEVDLNCGISQNGIRIDISTDPTDTTTAFIKVINNTPTLFKFHEDPCFKLTTDEFCFYVKPNTNKNESEIVYRYFAYFCLNKSSKNYICDHTTIRRKCCKNNDFFSLNGTCESDERSSEGQLWPIFTLSNLKNPVVLTGFPPACDEHYFNWDVDNISFLDNSSIYIEELNFITRDYCIAHKEEANGTLKEAVFVCASRNELSNRQCASVTHLRRYFTGVSCLCLLVTLCLYAFYPQIRRQKLHTWSFISMISAQLVALIAFEVNRSTWIESPAACMILAEICLVSVLAMFFWYSVISFDLAVKTWDGPELRDSRKWFVMYSIYAWGCPLVVGAVFFLINTLEPANAILPGIKAPNCWLSTQAAQWAYMKGFILAVMLVNLSMFIHLLYRLVQLRRSSMRVKTPYSHLCRRCRLPLSLGVMIGVCWLGEVASDSSCSSTISWMSGPQ